MHSVNTKDGATLIAVNATELERRLAEYFHADSRGAVAVYLFGSFGRGTARENSDVDVGILFEKAPAPTLEGQPYSMEADLAGLLGREVDVVALNDAPADLVHRVLRDGRLVYEGDRSARVRFEVAARNQYFDLLPILREYRRARSEHNDRREPG